jgi:beta-mannosidase
VPALSAIWLPEQDFSDQDTYGCYYAYTLEDQDGQLVGSGSVLFCAPKHFHFAEPQLQVRQEGDEIVVSAQAFARSVEIQCGADTVLSDNYFDMNAGEVTVEVLEGDPSKLRLRSVYDIR